MVEAAGAALWRHQGQRVRFRPVRVATEGNWGFLGALPVDPTSEDLCYDAEADFWGARPNSTFYSTILAQNGMLSNLEQCVMTKRHLAVGQRFLAKT